MPVVIKYVRNNAWQLNPWGKSVEPQRADLWVVDLNGVVAEFRASGFYGGESSHFYGVDTQYYVRSVQLPEQKVNAEVVRRDSRPYNMPSWDDPLGAIRMTFVHDIGQVGAETRHTSEIVKLLRTWRAVVRAGRGGMSTEDSFLLNSFYSTVAYRNGSRVPLHAFNVPLYLLKGPGDPGNQVDVAPDLSASDAVDISTVLEHSTEYTLVNAWLSSYQVSDLTYEGSQVLNITAVFFADDLYVSHTGQDQPLRDLGA